MAQRLAVDLDHFGFTESTVWTHGVFRPGRYVLESLVERAQDVDFAMMVLGPDDLLASRDSIRQAPRDNVVFELGLFMGALGPKRTYMVLPAGVDLKLPSDLDGITYLRYPTRVDNNLGAALSGVVLSIVDEVKGLGRRTAHSGQPSQPSGPVSAHTIEDDLRLLESNLIPQGWAFRWNEARTTLRVKSPRGTQHVLKMRPPQMMQADLDRFVRALRSGGARFDSILRRR